VKRTFTEAELGRIASLSAIGDFRERARALANDANSACEGETCNVRVVFGLRTLEEQMALWQKGRALKPGRPPKHKSSWSIVSSVVTRAFPGESAHNYGLAIDLALLGDESKAWLPGHDPRWRTVLGERARAAGLTWGGDFKSFFDGAHVELLGWESRR